MDVHLKPFRSLTPMESHGIRTIRYSAAGDMILIAAGNSQVSFNFLLIMILNIINTNS